MSFIKTSKLLFLLTCMLLQYLFVSAMPANDKSNEYAVSISVTVTNPTCTKNNGRIDIQVTSGVAPFSYVITGFPPRSYGIFQYLAPGSYNITVTDATSATATQTVTLVNQFTPPAASAVVNSFPTGCSNLDGTVTVNGSGGVPPYLYSIDELTYQPGNVFTGLTAGIYRYSVKDANGCTPNLGAFPNLSIPMSPSCPMNPGAGGQTLSSTCNPFLCFLALNNVTGGTPPYLYSLDGITYQTSNSWAAGVPEGHYVMRVKDATGLIALFTVIVKDHWCNPWFNITTIVQPAQCGINGSITVTAASGGTAPYLYSLDGATYQANNSFTGLTPGLHIIRVKDANDLISSVAIILTDNCVNVTTTNNNSSCGNSNGSIQAVASNGVAPYQYSIDAVNFNTTGNFTGLAAGNYTITVKDAINNIGTANVTIGNSNGPAVGTIVTLPADCTNQNGFINVSAMGGTAPLLYSIDGITYSPNPSFTGLAAGTYTVRVKDANGCISSSTATVALNNNIVADAGNNASICEGESIVLNGSSNAATINWSNAATLSDPSIYNPVAKPPVSTMYYLTATTGACSKIDSVFILVKPAPLANAGFTQTLCPGQSTTLNGSGGIVCSWQPSTYLSDPDICDPVVTKPSSNITYRLTVTGANGCKSIQSKSVTINITAPPKVFAGNDTSIVIGQQVQLFATDINGSGFNQFTWTPSNGLNNPFVQTPLATISNNIKYTVAAKTAAGCEGVDSISIKAFARADIFVPNAFSPNGDGRNDLLKAIPVGIKSFKYLAIYDRYGARVFYTTDAGTGWDGKTSSGLYNTGNFVWIAEGVNYLNQKVVTKGTVLILR
jgi:gliding motility-associated-like protein